MKKCFNRIEREDRKKLQDDLASKYPRTQKLQKAISEKSAGGFFFARKRKSFMMRNIGVEVHAYQTSKTMQASGLPNAYC